MKVVHFKPTMRLTSGGVTRAVLDLCQVMVAAGHDLVLMTGDPIDVPADWDGSPGRPACVPIQCSGNPWRPLAPEARRAVAQALDGADALHLHVIWDPAVTAVAKLAVNMNVPYVVSTHGMLDDWCMAQRGGKKRLYLATVGRRLLRDAAAFHCTAQAECDQAGRWCAGTRGVVIPYVLDLEPYRALPGPEMAREQFSALATQDPKILFLSRLHYKKGMERLLEAAATLRQSNGALRLLVAGSGEADYERELRAMAARLGLEDCTSFLGFVTGPTKLSLYQAADLFVLPTSQENFGFVLVEALACGTPVITTKGVDIWRELQESGGAVICEPGDPTLADSIADLLEDPGRRAEMGAAGRAFVLQWLDPPSTLDAYADLYQTADAESPM